MGESLVMGNILVAISSEGKWVSLPKLPSTTNGYSAKVSASTAPPLTQLRTLTGLILYKSCVANQARVCVFKHSCHIQRTAFHIISLHPLIYSMSRLHSYYFSPSSYILYVLTSVIFTAPWGGGALDCGESVNICFKLLLLQWPHQYDHYDEP